MRIAAALAAAAIVTGCGVEQEPTTLVPLMPPSTASTTTTSTSTTTTTTNPLNNVDWNSVGELMKQQQIDARETHGSCGEWHDLAISVGFSETDWTVLRQIISRETGRTCRPDLLNDNTKTLDNSWGLTQINTLSDLWPDRQQLCGLTEPADLLDPATNLACAHRIHQRSGWSPWKYPWTTTTTTPEGTA